MVRLRPALVGIVAATVGVVSATPGAYAAPSIDATPEKVAVVHSYENVRWSVNGVDLNNDWCSIELQHTSSRTLVDIDFADADASSGDIRIYDWEVRPGGYRMLAECDRAGNAVDDIIVKWGSRSSVTSTSRRGNTVAVAGTVTRWSPTYTAFRPWAGTKVTLQRYSAGRWRYVKTLTSDSRGRVSTTTFSSKPSSWRLSAKETSTTWGRDSQRAYR